VGAARWLARHGADVTVTDLADETVLAESLAALADAPIGGFHLGGHREGDFREADLVVVNPAVRPDNSLLEIARAAGARLTSEIELFLGVCPAGIVGVTGSNGKSTTAAMTAATLQAAGRRAWLGGNIGASLLDELDRIGREDWVVLELSSFQLAHLSRGARMPEVAVVTSFSANHLDWHGGHREYRAAKQRLLTGQKPGDVAVLNTTDEEVARWSPLVRGTRLSLVPESEIPPLGVPGAHNRTNAVCAATAALGVGSSADAVRRGLASFATLPHRLELLRVIAGRRFYNDSSSTTPESTIAALDAVEGPTWLLVGGHDKGIDFGGLRAAITRSAQGAAFYGAVGEKLYRRQVAESRAGRFMACETIDEALRWCWRHSRPGESIVLSPACSSHDQFRNFRQRGERFSRLVRALLS
ncbi:MAG: UDP-N-acetylmuramoyl-L-alanine--D-glutamate ligase, partial [Planctomycetes bacterium]|nr:UDP-N-acetylmuramoyl-L-alanine--D-glutamate ligase [Planctomycetota bacterium]